MLSIAGCAKPPQQAIDAAASAVKQLQADADVATYAPDALREAESRLAALEAEVTAEGKRPAFLRRYDETASLTAGVAAAIEAAKQATAATKERVRAEAQQIVTEVTAALPDVERKASTARRLRGRLLDSAAVAQSLAGVRAMLAEAGTDLPAGLYAAARAKANAAQDALAALTLELDQAILLARGR